MAANNEDMARLAAGLADSSDEQVFDSPQIAPASEAQAGPSREEIDRIRENRQPLDGRVEKLKVYGAIPGYHLHIFNDDGARLDEAQRHGYAFVKRTEIRNVGRDVASFNTDPGENVRFVVGKRDNGNVMYGYLMKIPEEIFQEDQQTQEAFNAGIDGAIRGGKVGTDNEATTDTKQRYTPIGNKYSPEQTILTR